MEINFLPSHTSCAEVMKANIFHLIKGYDLLTLELVLMAEFLKAVVTSREPKWSKVSCVINVGLSFLFIYSYVLQRAVLWWLEGTTDHLAGSTCHLRLQMSPS